MRTTRYNRTYEKFRDEQIAWASAEDLLLIMANELIRLKEESGMNLFWDKDEEAFLRDYIGNTEMAAQS